MHLAALVLVLGPPALVQVVQEPSQLERQAAALPLTAQIAKQGRFTPLSGVQHLLAVAGQSGLRQYARSCVRQAAGTFITHYVCQFANVAVAEAAYIQFQASLGASPLAVENTAVAGKAGTINWQAVLVDPKTGAAVYWLLSWQGRWLYIVVVEGLPPETTGADLDRVQTLTGEEIFCAVSDGGTKPLTTPENRMSLCSQGK